MQDLDKISLNFILSTGRTGSTLLSSMLNMHPNVISTSEEPFAYKLYPKYHTVTKWDDIIIEEFCYDFFLFSQGKLKLQFGKKEDLYNLLKSHQSILTGEYAIKLAYMAFFPNKNKDTVNTIVDKELIFHYVLDKVAAYYPNSKYIILHRDPRDNVLVKLKRAKIKGRGASLFYFAKFWNYTYKTLDKKLKKISSAKYIHVKYEDLVSKPEQTLQLICKFLNIKYHEDMLLFNEKFNQEMNSSNSLLENSVKNHISILHQGLTQKVNTDKLGLWKKDLSEAENNIIWSICGEIAEKHGYSADGCKKVSYFKISYLYDWLQFSYKRIMLPTIYHNLPFKLKYFIKKLKYDKQQKQDKLIVNFYSETKA
jgi:hypothetical protein